MDFYFKPRIKASLKIPYLERNSNCSNHKVIINLLYLVHNKTINKNLAYSEILRLIKIKDKQAKEDYSEFKLNKIHQLVFRIIL